MSESPFCVLASISATIVAGYIAFGSTTCIGQAAGAAATPGLAPQFNRWPVPLYTANVLATMTWAPVSYEIDTKDTRSRVIAWYLAKLHGRVMQIHKSNPRNRQLVQLAVDNGDYVVNLINLPHGTSINVIKN